MSAATTYGVVTKVPSPPDIGNLASAAGSVWLDAQATGGGYPDPPTRLGEALGQPMLELFVQVPVFTVGELLVMDHNDRDLLGRKPGKWSVEVDYFDDIDLAVARAREVVAVDA